MKKYLFIGCGGFLGAIARFFVKSLTIYHYSENLPLNTLIINVSGSLVLAFLSTLFIESLNVDASISAGMTTGFLGGFTTFSTLCKESVLLFGQGDYFSAVSYLTISIFLGLGAALLGVVLAREWIGKGLKERYRKDHRTSDGSQNGGSK